MPLLEGVLVLAAQGHHGAHVDLVEGGQHGGGVLGLLQPAGDGLAQAGHAHPLFALVGRTALDTGDARGRRGGGRRRRGGAGLQGGEGVALGDASILAGGRDLRRIDPGLGHDALNRRRQGHGGGCDGRRCGSRSRDGRQGWGGSLGRGRRRNAGRRRRGRAAVADVAQHLARGHRVALADRDVLQHAVSAGRDFQRDLLRLQLDQDLVLLDRLARLLGPARHRGFGDGLSQRRRQDVGHALALQIVRRPWRGVRRRRAPGDSSGLFYGVVAVRRRPRPGRSPALSGAGSSDPRPSRRWPDGRHSGRAWP